MCRSWGKKWQPNCSQLTALLSCLNRA
jgi:hypothetical protein